LSLIDWRQIRKHKVTSAVAVLSVGLAIGACTAAFRLADALLLRPLPVAHPERLYSLSRQAKDAFGNPAPYDGWEYPAFLQMRAAVSGRADVVAMAFSERAELTYSSDEAMEKARVQYVSGGMFGSFGLRPALGRLLTESDDRTPGAHPVAVVSHDYWVRRMGADPGALGRTFRLGKVLFQVVGVAEPGFTGTEPGSMVDVFMPTMMYWGIEEPRFALFKTFVHLHAGVAMEPVRDRLHAAFHVFWTGAGRAAEPAMFMESAAAGLSTMQRNFRLPMAALGVLVGLVLLIACANVANLMAAQTAARSREMTVRVAMGAGKRMLMQLVLAEGAAIAIPAAAIGMGFAWWAGPFLVARINAPDNPARLELLADWRVTAFGIALTFAAMLLFSLAPALGASRVSPSVALKGGDARVRRVRLHTAIALQSAFCFLVLFVAGLFVATFDRISHLPTGFSSERVLTLDTVTPHHNDPIEWWDHVAERLRAVPGVESVAFADWPTLDGYGFKANNVAVEGGPPDNRDAWFSNVSPGWFETMKIPLLAGRDFRSDDTSPGAAIVNETFARQHFNGRNALGSWFEGTSAWMKGQRFQIVGIARDARYRFLRQDVLPVAYTPFHRTSDKGTLQGGTFIVRTVSANPLTMAATLRREIALAQPGFRVSTIRTQQDLIEAQTVRERLLAMLGAFFGAVAVLLAAIGMYGVLSYSVLQRRREIGIRVAVGAQPGRIARLLVAGVFGMVVAGLAVGVALGLGVGRYLEALLFGVKAGDAMAMAGPVGVMMGVAVLAAAPAVARAWRIDPVEMLRAE
jgi:predicted permease